MKKIGFVDYYLNEWHADNYPAWIAANVREKGGDFVLSYAWAERDEPPCGGDSTDVWCKRNGAERCASIEELCEKSDCIFILSPDNPEKHLEYAKRVFPFGKPVYVDKTFAPDLAAAVKIYELSEKYGTPFFSSSALGFADELADAGKARNFMTTGGGRNFEIYSVHQLEMVVKAMGTGAKRVIAAAGDSNVCVFVDYGDGRSAEVSYSDGYPFSVAFEREGAGEYRPVVSAYFENMINAILRFFESGVPAVEKARTLEVIALRDACISALKNPFSFVNVEKH